MHWRLGKLFVAGALASAVAWWLFADTARHYTGMSGAQELRISFRGSYLEYQMWTELLESFRNAHPEIPIKAEYIAGVSYEQKMQQLLVADAAPDIMITDLEPFPAMLQSDQFEDLMPYLDTPGAEVDLQSLWPVSVKGYTVERNGRKAMYAVPVWGGCMLICFNRESFSRSNIRLGETGTAAALAPAADGDGWILDDTRWTNDDLVRVAKLLTIDEDADGRIDQFGLVHPGYFYWLPWVWSAGADVIDATGQYTTFYGTDLERAFQMWQDLVYVHGVSPGNGQLPGGSYVGFMSRRVAMIIEGPWMMPFLNDTRMKYGFLHMPRDTRTGNRSTRVTWDGLLIYKQSRRKEDAWRFIHHVLSPDCQRIVARYQRSVPALREALDAFQGRDPEVGAHKFVEAIAEYGRPGVLTRYWYELERNLTPACDEMIDASAQRRFTPAEAIGKFLSSDVARDRLPPLDGEAAEPYRKAYRARMERGS